MEAAAGTTNPENTRGGPFPASAAQPPHLRDAALSAPPSGANWDHRLRSFADLRGVKSLAFVGGSFDPFTQAHYEIPLIVEAGFVEKGWERSDAVLFMPAKQNPHKSQAPGAKEDERLEIVRRSILDRPNWFVSSFELDKDRISYTIDTLRELRAALGAETKIYLILGSDCCSALHRWKEYQEVFKLITPVILSRHQTWSEVRAEIEGRLPGDIVAQLERGFILQPTLLVSSTAVRHSLRQGIIPRGALTQAAQEYIASRGLYGLDRDSAPYTH